MSVDHRQLVVLDATLPDQATLRAALPIDAEVLAIGENEAGVAHLTAALEGRTGLAALHLITHGAPGRIHLGRDRLEEAQLSGHAPLLAAIGRALAGTGEWLIYGCEVAQETAGRSLVAALAVATGIRVAASSRPVGHADLGGGWTLDWAFVPSLHRAAVDRNPNGMGLDRRSPDPWAMRPARRPIAQRSGLLQLERRGRAGMANPAGKTHALAVPAWAGRLGLTVTEETSAYPHKSGGEYGNFYAFAALMADGSVVTWGDSSYGGYSGAVADKLDGTVDVVQVYSSGGAFAALRADGSLVTWGGSDEGGDSSAVASQLDGTVDVSGVYSTFGAFAALRDDGSVVTWGGSEYGGNSRAVAEKLNGTVDVIQVYSAQNAFAALRVDGSVVTWGDKPGGGNSSAVASLLDGTVDVSRIYATTFAFAALRVDGSVVTWGSSGQGGNSSAVASRLNGTVDVTEICPTWNAFAALRADGSVVTWGSSGEGGNSSAVASRLDGTVDVTRLFSTHKAFAALRADGSVVTWGDSGYGGNSRAVASQLDGTVDVIHICSTASAFAALRADGSVVTWGNSASGGNSSTVANQLNGSVDVVQLYSNGYSFAALRADGSVVTWGDNDYGGNSGTAGWQLDGTVDVVDISSTWTAFTALRADGSVVAWGDSEWGGDSEVASQLTGVVGMATPFTDDVYTPSEPSPDDPLLFSSAPHVAIPDNGTTTSTLTVTGVSGTIADIDVRVNIEHEWDSDLDVWLIAPDGRKIELFTDVGGMGDNFANTVLDAKASTSIASADAPFTGSFVPEGDLSALYGVDPNGVWTLKVTDDGDIAIGTLHSWGLVIEPLSNHAPTLQPPNTITYTDTAGNDSFQTVTGVLAGSDVDSGTTLVYGISGGTVSGGTASRVGSYGTLSVDTGTGAYIYTPNDSAIEALDADADETFTVTVSDGMSTAEALFTVDITGTPDLGPDDALVFTAAPALVIPNNGSKTSAIVVSGVAGTITDLNVKVNITHPFDGDLDVYLVAPNGQQVELFTDVGGGGDNFTNTVLDGEATASITGASAPFTGSFAPEGDLSSLYGLDPNGTWTLKVTDDAADDKGTLDSWGLEMEVNHAPTIETPSPIAYTDTSGDDSFSPANGVLVSSDVDQDTALVYGIGGATVVGGEAIRTGSYGTLTVDTHSGAYTYTPNDAAIEGLKAGASESFMVSVSDGVADAIATLTVALTGANDTPTGTVAVQGKAEEGQTLTASHTLGDAEGLGDVSWQWLRDTVVIAGVSGNTYTLGADDVGHTIAVRASYTDGKGTHESVTSVPTEEVTSVDPSLVFTGIGTLVVSESGESATFQVALLAAPRHDVYVTFSSDNPAEGGFRGGSGTTDKLVLIFTPDNWASAQAVTVVGVDDKPEDGDRSFNIQTTTESLDTRYDGMRSGIGLPIPNIMVVNRDDDMHDVWYGSDAKDDYYRGGHGASDLYGKDGRDEIYGDYGDDRVYGGYGDDVLFGEADNDQLEGEQGNDRLKGGEGDDRLLGGSGDDRLYGEAGNDELEGGENNDELSGDEGDDTLIGGTGRDTLLGGAGSDRLDGSEYADSMDGGNGADIYIVDDAGDSISDSGRDGSVDTVQVIAYLSQNFVLGTGVEAAVLDNLAKEGGLTGNSADNTLTGNDSNNRIDGGQGNDVLDGGGGDDTIEDGSGNDTVHGGVGNDLFAADAGGGNDRYVGGDGKDTVSYVNETASLLINLFTGDVSGADVGTDSLDSLNNIENAVGGRGNDTLIGSNSDNKLDGSAGNDLLHGGNGRDTLTGGAGNDKFDFDELREISTGNTRGDVITDFTPGADKIDLSTIDANTATAGVNDAFTGFISANASFSSAGQLQLKGGVLYGNTDADVTAEFALQLTRVTVLGLGDVVV